MHEREHKTSHDRCVQRPNVISRINSIQRTISTNLHIQFYNTIIKGLNDPEIMNAPFTQSHDLFRNVLHRYLLRDLIDHMNV